jgi:hypothetical protein
MKKRLVSKRKQKPTSSRDKAAQVREALEQVKAGQTIPAEEVEAWIRSWDTRYERPMPVPRTRKITKSMRTY